MPVAEKKKAGGARPNSGPKKGAVYNAVILRRQKQGVTLRDIESQIQKRASKLIDAQYISALGTFQVCVIGRGENGKVSYIRVTDEGKMNELLDNGELGKDYMVFAGQDPDWKAADALLNRGFGKARESIVHSGVVGVAHIIKSLNQSDENNGESEE